MRSMLGIVGLLFAFNVYASHRATLEDTSNETYDLRAGAPLAVTTYNGSIRIHAASTDSRIHVTMRTHVRAESDDDARRAMNEMKVRVSHDNGGLALIAPELRRWDDEVEGGVSFDIDVPQSLSLTLQTTNGAIDVDGVRGDHVVRTTNGHINVENSGGSVDAETTNGGIRVALSDVTPGRPLRFITTNGGITLDLPSTLNADVEASTSNGSIHTDLPILTNRAESHSLSGRINGGGQPMRVRTTNGSITIRSGAAARQ